MHPGSIYDFDITQKNSMCLAEFGKIIKGLSSKIFLVSKMFLTKAISKNNPVFRAEVAGNFDITPVSIHAQRFTGHIYDWNILNDRPIKKIALLTSTWGSLSKIAKCLTYPVLICERVRLMVKVWFTVLIYQTFKAFREAIKYTLFEVTIARLNFW